jgi:phage/plasmid-like protein (TIGR03299 family)
MAHELTIRADGFVEMAYVGRPPWHQLGNEMWDGATTEDWIAKAGMGHQILSQPVQYQVGDETYVVADRMMLCRSDNKHPLGIVSSDYHVIQPREVISFFDDLITSLGLTMETAGTLFGGKQYWALARIAENAVLDHDKMRGYLLLSTSADGSRKTVGKFTCVRVVCNNTLCLSDNHTLDSGGSVTISHRTEFDPEALKAKLGITPKTLDTLIADLEILARKKLRTTPARDITNKVFGEKSRSVPHVMKLFQGEAIGYDQPNFPGTAWGLLNSITEYVDWQSFAKTDSHRINSSLFGNGDQRKRHAYKLLLEYAS